MSGIQTQQTREMRVDPQPTCRKEPDGSYAAGAEGLTVINGKLASQVQQCGQELAAHR